MAVDAHGNQEQIAGNVPPPTTNNRMELLAVSRALHHLYEKYGPIEAEIVSDSKYVVLGATYPERARRVNQDLWEKIDTELARHRHIQFRHIRGHAGVKYNELADELAVQAKRKSRYYGCKHYDPEGTGLRLSKEEQEVRARARADDS